MAYTLSRTVVQRPILRLFSIGVKYKNFRSIGNFAKITDILYSQFFNKGLNRNMNTGLTLYIEREILPRYNGFDKAHREDHARMVIKQSLEIARHYAVNMEMVYAVAAFHDLGLAIDRKTHHLESGRIIREDQRLHEWFTQEEIETMAQAVEDHRASSDHEPRSIYGKIVAEGDRYIEPEKIIERTIQYGLDHYPKLDKEGHWQRTLDHLHEKYAEGGYLKLWFPESPNVERLNSLREIIKDEPRLRRIFDKIYSEL